jgi:excisionase family DNA binding protein
MNAPLAYNVPEACDVSRTGRTELYKAIKSGELRAVKRERRTLILADDLRRWLESLPPVTPRKTNPENDAPRCGDQTAYKTTKPGFVARC